MSEEDQERFEDYLELECYIEELQAGHVTHPPPVLTLKQARIYRMLVLFRTASPQGVQPRPEFTAALWARLEQRLQQPSKPQLFSFLCKKLSKNSPRVSRRGLLTGGVAVAISLGMGAGIKWIAEQIGNHEGLKRTGSTDIGTHTTYGPPLEAISTAWHFVTTLELLDDGIRRFTTDTIVGYVLRGGGTNDGRKQGQIIALSAACTHMGCLVQWHASDREFHCPCHGGVFTENGLVGKSSSVRGFLSPLPRLETKVEDGNVYVRVPLGRR